MRGASYVQRFIAHLALVQLNWNLIRQVFHPLQSYTLQEAPQRSNLDRLMPQHFLRTSQTDVNWLTLGCNFWPGFDLVRFPISTKVEIAGSVWL